MSYKTNLPSKDECYLFFKELNIPFNIISHMETVNKIANYLSSSLVKKGENVNIELVDRASLVHDIGKWQEIQGGISHYEFGYNFLLNKGYPELASLVRYHGVEIIFKKLNLSCWEQKIMTYSDSRAYGSEILPFKRRLELTAIRYPEISHIFLNDIVNVLTKLEEEFIKYLDNSLYQIENL